MSVYLPDVPAFAMKFYVLKVNDIMMTMVLAGDVMRCEVLFKKHRRKKRTEQKTM